jgi:FKBP-type peptidyl-prolyl cis-trans isomerase FklB
MRKLPNIAICVLAATLIFAGTAAARQSSATNPSTAPPAASAPAATDNSTPAAKPATTAKPAAKPASKTQNATSSPNGTSTQTPGTAKTQSGTATRTPAGAATQHHAAVPLVLKTDKDKESYAIGLNIGKSIHRDGVDVDPNILSRGMKDALSGAKPALTDDEAKAVMMSLQTRVRKQQAEQTQVAAEAAKKVGEANKTAGDAFLAANKTKEGIVTLPSGLQYKILTQGTGPKPTAADTVVCNYKGTLLDNTEFDSSYSRKQPLTIPVSGVIKGWTEALQLMPVGSKWQLFIPSDLAYGPQAKGPIGANSTLIFEVELLSIQEKKEPPK